MALNVRVEGVENLIRQFDVVKANVARGIQDAADSGAKQVRDKARAAAPIRGTDAERKADRSLRRKFGASKGLFKGKAPGLLRRRIVIRKGRQGIVNMVQAKAPHAHLQEYGTKRGVKARHFMEKAKDELLPGIQRDIIAAVGREVK